MPVELKREGHLAILTLNRPEARNAINGEMTETMEACLDDYESDSDLWCGILTAEGPVFSAGADLKEIARGTGAAPSVSPASTGPPPSSSSPPSGRGTGCSDCSSCAEEAGGS